jgi:hypothetical protein
MKANFYYINALIFTLLTISMKAQENWYVPVDIGQHIDIGDTKEEIIPDFENYFDIDLIVKEFSARRARIFVVITLGHSRWHHYYFLLKNFIIDRNNEIDHIFKLNKLQETYTATYQTIGHGSSYEQVENILGNEYFEYTGQSPQLRNIYYEDHNLEVVIQDFHVKYITKNRPGWMNSDMYEKHTE